jgi:membrane dipeptidase
MTKSMLLSGLAALALLAPPAFAQSGKSAPKTPEAIAAAALKAAPIFDGHNDVPWTLRQRVGNVLRDFDFHDTTDHVHDARGVMHTDLRRLRAGGVGAQYWSVYVPSNVNEQLAVQQTVEQIDVMRRLAARYPNELTLAKNSIELERAMKAGKIAGMLGIEGGQSIGSSLGVLREMHGMGVRYMTLTHGKNVPWADSATDVPVHGGLTDFGAQVVQEMNRIGMIVDLSHVSEATMVEALAVTRAPVIFSHSSAKGVTDHPRNVPDAVLPLLKANGGIVMVTFVPGFINAKVRAHGLARTAEDARLKAEFVDRPAEVKAGLAAWDKANPAPKATISDVADHIDHIRKAIGVDHIGIGGDYDGIDTVPQGLEDVSTYPALFTELARRGYTQAELMQISSGNALRVLKAVEAYAASQKDAPVVETAVK